MDSEKEMLKYVRYSLILTAGFVPVFFAMSLALIVVVLQNISGPTSLLVSLLGLSVGLFMMYFSLFPFRNYKKMINFLRNNGIYQEAISDFISAKPFMNDRIRMGNKYIFCGRQCVILRYYDICKLSQDSYETEAGERSRSLKADDISGNVWYLCALKLNTDNQPGLKEAVDFTLSKNSRIVIDF